MELISFFVVYFLWWMVWVLGFFILKNKFTFPWYFVFIFSFLFRCVFFITFPYYEDDWARYLWDGYIFYKTGSPYSSVPIDWFSYFSEEDIENYILSKIGFPHYPTIYFPIYQVFFLISYILFGWSLWGLRIIFFIFDLGTLYYLFKIHQLTNHTSKPQWLLYAWGFCPLWVLEFYLHLHADIIGIFFLVSFYYYFIRKKIGKAILMGGFSLSTKPLFLILIFILFIYHWKRNNSTMLRLLPVTLGSFFVFIFTWIYFIFKPQFQITNIFGFFQDFIFNPSLYLIIHNLSIKPIYEKLILGVLYCILLFFFKWKESNEAQYLVNSLVSFFLILPVVNSWYILWGFPFLFIILSSLNKENFIKIFWILIWSLTIIFSYANGKNLGIPDLLPYEHPWWVLWIEYIPMYLIFLFFLFYLD